MPTIKQVAKYILDKKGSVTNMKLQKLCYYCQAWSLAWDETPIFDEDFEAWADGPVCPELYYSHKGKFSVSSKDFSDCPDGDFNPDQIETIEKVLEAYGDKEPWWLSELTHEEAPWKLARGSTPPGEKSHNIVTKENMQQYYGGLI